ncbi:hypothetical protein BKA93DRAFT_723405 [Sparassis latifolia]
MVKESLTATGKDEAYSETLQSVDERLKSLKKSGEVAQGQTSANVLQSSWRAAVRVNVQAVVEPLELAWMDDDNPLTDVEYTVRALKEIEGRFTDNRPLYNPAAKARRSLAQNFAKLSSTLRHAGVPSSSWSVDRPEISTVSVYMPVATLLLEGSGEDVTAVVRKSVYDALAQTLRYHTHAVDVSDFEHTTDMIVRGMKDGDRSVRLGAGQALVDMARIYQANGNGAWKRAEGLFAMLYRLFELKDARVKETALITVGRIGKIATAEILGQAVCCLVSQLGKQSPMLNGTAYLQLQSLAKYHRKTPYNLLSPYMDSIAPFLVSRICTQRSMLVEACQFISVSYKDFVGLTLNRTLPQIFANCELRVVEEVAKETDMEPQKLLLAHCPEILAYAFRLQGPGQSQKALGFILGLLREAGGDAIDIGSVVRSYIVPLLAELVVVLGADNPDEADTGMQALTKIERCVSQPRNGSRGTPPENTGAFLKSYMLGIMSHLNDRLQDVQRRRSLDLKRKVLRSLGPFISLIGTAVSGIAPQIMTSLQSMLVVKELADVTLQSWHVFLTSLETRDLGPHVGPTSASFVAYWPAFSTQGRDTAKRCLTFIVCGKGADLGPYLNEVVDLGTIPELSEAQERLAHLRRAWKPRDKLQRILERATSESVTVAVQSLYELKAFMSVEEEGYVRALASGDVFDPLVGQILSTLFAAACRDGDDTDTLHMVAFDCIGVLGAVDPDRLDMGVNDTRIVMLSNFMDEAESASFALHLIRDILVGAFRSTSDINYQSYLAYAIQELLHFCKFTSALVTPGSTNSISLKVRNRWNSLPKHVLETVTPLLDSRFKVEARYHEELQHPIYPTKQTYREWIQSWTGHLLNKASGEQAVTIFNVFPAVVRNKDVGVAHHLLPHLVLNVLISGEEDDTQQIRSELLAVLEDQVETSSQSSADKKLLSAQTVFMLMDHINQWVRVIRQDISSKKAESKRARANQVGSEAEEQLLRVDSILSSIDPSLMAKAALQCKAYARSLMNFEQQVVTLRANNANSNQLHEHYERLHEIYAHLDEPDGMEGISTLILSPSLEHQIRQHESTGRWTSAQSCWEVRLQQSPDNLDFHLGLLRCLRNLGHYDTLRTHVKGVLVRNPNWQAQLVGFQVESEWMVGNWGEVQILIRSTEAQTSPILLAQVLLAMRAGDTVAISDSLAVARRLLGTPIIAAGAKGYRRSYDAVLDLHLVHELEVIHNAMTSLPGGQGSGTPRRVVDHVSQRLSARFNSTLPTFRIREPILSMRRTAFGLSCSNAHSVKEVIGQAWLASAKIARKAGHWQTAYSAMLQAQHCKLPFSFMQNVKLIKASGEPLRALQELENSMRLSGIMGEDVIDLTDDKEDMKLKAKAQLLRARWMNESDRFDASFVVKAYQNAADLCPKWESGQFYLGQFQDECYKALSREDQLNRGMRMNLQTVRNYVKAMRYGSKYIYQTVPRVLTLWMDMGEDGNIAKSEIFQRINMEVSRAIKSVPVYKWFTAFPQIVSRVGHGNDAVYGVLSKLISMVIQEYPKQALWLFTSVVKSTKPQRADRGKLILDKLRVSVSFTLTETNVPKLINDSLHMTEELLSLCDYPVREDKKTLSMTKDFPSLFRLAPSQLVIPLQESLTVSLPPTSSSEIVLPDGTHAVHQPFPLDVPTFARFHDEIDVMRSLAKPRKITIQGSNGQIYMFLGKPKDDLRKDARLMDFNAIVNKLLKSNSESRRRQLHIRTYGVVTLNEECGFIQWVPNTIPIRPILMKGYERRNVRSWSPEMNLIFAKIKETSDKEGAQIFVKEILPVFPPVFHDWFVETFPEPTAWLASRLAYSRTAAVMSMVGFIVGLGDRHCENILLDINTGDAIHVDFNCLFEKGKTLETPERVPFRLTQNVVDGMGVTGVEGCVFRIACEVTMQLLRENKDSLMSVLDAFVHDPLVEWEDEKRKMASPTFRRNTVRASVDLRSLAKNALKTIDKKLKGIYTTSRERTEKEISTSGLVQVLIQEASDDANLAKMYPGWTPWH